MACDLCRPKPDYRLLLEDLKIQVAEHLFEYMKKNRLNQSNLAEIHGVSRAYVSRILKGNVNLTLETVSKLYAMMGKEIVLNIKPWTKDRTVEEAIKKAREEK